MNYMQAKSHLLTNATSVDRSKYRSAKPKSFIWIVVLLPWSTAMAEHAQPSVTIHWQQLPLRDALHRLENLFNETVFLDRRVDPGRRLTLDIEASNLDQAIGSVARGLDLDFVRLGSVVYLGPPQSKARLVALSSAKMKDVARLPRSQRESLQRKREVSWLRLTEPRQLLTSLVESSGWRIVGAERIPHDLWRGGRLPPLSMAEQLSVLLIGFHLTFEVSPSQRAIMIVPLPAPILETQLEPRSELPKEAGPLNRSRQTRQLYTLRVREQPVDAVLSELARRLRWKIHIEHESIQATGRSLKERVSFAVEEVEQEDLLKALLNPAGLDFRRTGDQITVIPLEHPH